MSPQSRNREKMSPALHLAGVTLLAIFGMWLLNEVLGEAPMPAATGNTRSEGVQPAKTPAPPPVDQREA